MYNFRKGVTDGLPIGLGYLSVSFAFGLFAVSKGLTWYEALMISAFNLTSAGQFSGVNIMTAAGSYIELALSQLVINMRYALMSTSLSQKADSKFSGIRRLIPGFFITDEIYAVACNCGEALNRRYFLGLSLLPYLGWMLGTLVGAVLGNILPLFLVNALGIALYGMLIAIVIPATRDDKHVLITVLISVGLSTLIYYTSDYTGISAGFSVIICAVFASLVGMFFFPIQEKAGDSAV